MILNNYWKYFKNVSENNPPTGSNVRYSFGLIFPSYYDVTTYLSDSSANVLADTPSSDAFHTWVIHNGLKMFLGNGTDEPTADDFGLKNKDITNQFKNYNCNYSIANDHGKSSIIFTASGVNGSDSDITISEVLIVKQIKVNYGTGYGNYCPWIAFVHELLDEPIVVESGTEFIFPYKWEIG